jgi:adenylate cyclase
MNDADDLISTLNLKALLPDDPQAHQIMDLLPPAISLKLRKLIRQNLDRLGWLPNASRPLGDPPDTQSADPAVGLDQQLLQDPNLLLARLYRVGYCTEAVIPQLEKLVTRHQDLLNQGVKSRRSLNQTEQEIFNLLGLQLTQNNSDGTILIVDDTPGNLKLLSAALVQQGYEVRNAINGSLALSGAKTIKPDLILLDIMMPGMDGYEVCRRLKQDPQTHDIPVIFISAIDGVVDKVKAFEVGGVDYVSKPFQIEEVLVRIEHQLKIWTLQRRLEEQNLRLQQDSQTTRKEPSQDFWEKSPDAMFRTTPDGTFQAANLALAQVLGYNSPQQLMQTGNTASFYVQPGRHGEFVAQMQQADYLHQFESQMRRQDGGVIWVSESVQAVRDHAGALLYYEGRLQDLTPLKQAIADRDIARQRIRKFLVSLFPKTIAKQFIRDSKNRLAQQFTQTTLLMVQPQPLPDGSKPASVWIEEINQLNQTLEGLAALHHVEYLRPYGQGFIVAAGLPKPRADHADVMVRYALALRQQQDSLPIAVRLAVHTGPITAGIIGGEQRLGYELYGPTLEIVQQLADHRDPQQILISAATSTALTASYALRQNSRSDLPSFWI